MEKDLELYLHGEGLKDPQIITLHPQVHVKEIIKRFLEITTPSGAVIDDYDVFIEDKEIELTKEGVSLEELEIEKHTHVHCHRVKTIEVSVNFNGRFISRSFQPQTTIQKVLHWSFNEFHIPPHDQTDLLNWPFAIIWIKCRHIEGSPDRYYFRFDLTGYPGAAPTACPWNIEQNQILNPNSWPKGTGNIQTVFNPGWRATALYAPCDREAMVGHEGWREQFKGLWWQSDFTIVVYLRFLHKLLNSSHYVGQ